MKIALAQYNAQIGNFKSNYQKIKEGIQKAIEQKADLIIFPELFLCGYPPMDWLDKKHFWETNAQWIEKIQKEIPHSLAVILGGLRKPDYNTAYFFYQGKIFTQDKTLLPTYDVFDEDRYFSPAKEWNVIDFHGKKIFLSICEDIWDGYHFRPHEKVKEKIDILINISASPFEKGKIKKRLELLSSICQEKQCLGIYVNMVGANDELIFDGNSFAVNAKGELIFQAEGFQENLFFLEIEKVKTISPVFKDPIEEIYNALLLGIKDYFKKTGFQKAVLGLSGGIDSAVVAYLASQALGKENLTALLLPGPYSSDHSITDAKKLAENIGIQHLIIPIQDIYNQFLSALKPVFQQKPFDITEENLQSRIRGNIIMAYSNKYNALVLNTGNKSELATGYCTLYGDMAGALSVIGDLYKTQVYELANWINREKEIIPWHTIQKAPSAELRENQTDQDSLPPYPVLDAILLDWIEEGLSLSEIVEKHSYDKALVEEVIRKIKTSEYKRRQAPIVLKVSKKAFGSGRRIPITSSFV